MKMKNIFAVFFALTLIFSSVGSYVYNDISPIAEAKKYRSGQKGFNQHQSPTTNSYSNTQTKKSDNMTTSKSTTATPKTKGSFMKGLMLGGLAGLLFGNLFANLGILGSILGLLINLAAIAFLISVVIKVIRIFSDKKHREREVTKWHK